MKEQIAKIRSTELGIEDHGILTFVLFVDYRGGMGQGIGTYALDAPVWIDKEGRYYSYEQKENSNQDYDFFPFEKRFGTAYGAEFIKRVISVVGVSKWEDVAGKHIVVLTPDSHGIGSGQPLGIANIDDPDNKLLFDDLYLEMEALSSDTSF